MWHRLDDAANEVLDSDMNDELYSKCVTNWLLTISHESDGTRNEIRGMTQSSTEKLNVS